MTLTEVETRIRAIARRSKNFKIGETGMTTHERLSVYPGYSHIEQITYSKDRDKIDDLERKMIDVFINYKGCDNLRGGSAGKMTKSAKYILYVAFNPK